MLDLRLGSRCGQYSSPVALAATIGSGVPQYTSHAQVHEVRKYRISSQTIAGKWAEVLGRKDSPTRFSRDSAVLKQSCEPSPLLFIAHRACVACSASQLTALASALFVPCTLVLLSLDDLQSGLFLQPRKMGFNVLALVFHYYSAF